MHEKTVKRSTAVAIGAGLPTAGLLVGTVGTVPLPRADEKGLFTDEGVVGV